ncbi:MAG TPA: site-2 protease family protein [Candidatus Hydrogenedentes bacterium]|nr:site-2 protease family protein [Candidatus Hydrogenedentota bacterium]
MVLVDIVVFVFVLGLLVFVHELGHFVAAKSCGIYCARFSLGMPPRVWGFQWGDTDYCIGALPIGGYVKMAGQEDKPLSDEERQQEYGDVPPDRWFNNKTVWQRVIVIVAGPLMNLALGFVLYGIVAAMGGLVPESKIDNRIGYIEPGSPAQTAPLHRMTEGGGMDFARPPDAVGWKTGDRILSVGGKPVDNILDVAMRAILGGENMTEVVLERADATGGSTRYLSPVQPRILDDSKHPRFGVQPFSTALVKAVTPGMPAADVIQPGDVIVRLNGELIDSQTFTRTVESLPAGQSVVLEVEREGRRVPATIVPATVGRMKGVRFFPWLDEEMEKSQDAPLTVLGTTPDMKEKTDLRAGDVVVAIDGQPATPVLLRGYEKDRPGQTVTLTIKRPDVWFGLLRKGETKQVVVAIDEVRAVGMEWDTKMTYQRVPPAQVVPEAFARGIRALSVTMETLIGLTTGNVTPKELGGPVLIYQATTGAARMGYTWLLEMTAFISVNLCVFNLLPLPVLDGGQLVFLAIEGVRRKPVSLRIQEWVQQAGLVLIVALILYVTYNDLVRIVTNRLQQ